jgi:hypothetical protein
MSSIGGEIFIAPIHTLIPYRFWQLSTGADIREGHNSAFYVEYFGIEANGGPKLRRLSTSGSILIK